MELDRSVLRGGLEVAILVEHVVRGQQGLHPRREDFSAFEQRDAIGCFPAGRPGVLPHATDQQTCPAGRGRQPLEQLEVPVDEPALEQQITRGIARRGEFGANHHLNPRLDAAPIRGEDSDLVAGKVTDGRVDLGESDSHAVDACHAVKGGSKKFPSTTRARCGQPCRWTPGGD